MTLWNFIFWLYFVFVKVPWKYYKTYAYLNTIKVPKDSLLFLNISIAIFICLAKNFSVLIFSEYYSEWVTVGKFCAIEEQMKMVSMEMTDLRHEELDIGER